MTGISSLGHRSLGAPGLKREPAAHRRREPEPIVLRRPENRRLASLDFAAEKDFLALARMTAMHVGGLLGLPIGRVTDLRLAVDEACSLFLNPNLHTAAGSAPPPDRTGGRLSLRFDRTDATLRIRVTGPAPWRRPDEDDLGWTMLCALVGEPRWEARDGVGTLTMTEPIPTGRR
jgi:serine/threonine-protein kinase RsbW